MIRSVSAMYHRMVSSDSLLHPADCKFSCSSKQSLRVLIFSFFRKLAKLPQILIWVSLLTEKELRVVMQIFFQSRSYCSQKFKVASQQEFQLYFEWGSFLLIWLRANILQYEPQWYWYEETSTSFFRDSGVCVLAEHGYWPFQNLPIIHRTSE